MARKPQASRKAIVGSRTASFLELEFEALYRRAELLEARKHRLGVTLVGTFGVLAAGTLARLDAPATTKVASAVLFGMLLAVGLLSARSAAQAGIQVVLLYRRAGRVRQYFADQDPQVRPYLPWAPGDDTPPLRDSRWYTTLDMGESAVGFTCVASATALAHLLGPTSGGWAFALPLLGATLTLAVISLIRVTSVRAAEREAARPYNTRFPYREGAAESLDGHH